MAVGARCSLAQAVSAFSSRMHLTGPLLDGSDVLRAYVRGARAGSTQRAYAAQWQQFATWCGGQGVSALLADPRLVAEYLAVRAQAGVAVASINLMLAAVCFMHKMSGFGFARTDPILMLVLDGIRREHVGLQRQAEPLTGRLLGEVLAQLGEEPADVRDAALLCLLYAFALRPPKSWRSTGSSWEVEMP